MPNSLQLDRESHCREDRESKYVVSDPFSCTSCILQLCGAAILTLFLQYYCVLSINITLWFVTDA